jgi:hypothetical protein
MKAASDRVLNPRAFPFTGQDLAMVANLKKVAATFSKFHDERQAADYDTTKQWSRSDVLELIDATTEAFQSMSEIRGQGIANDYLLSLLLKERR